MAREIKFRVWDKEGKKMHPVLAIGKCLYRNYPEGGFYDDDTEYVAVESKSWDEREFLEYAYVELMQFTGLKDKNGKEVYEGDVVTSKVPEAPGLVVTHKYIVKWSDEIAGFNVSADASLEVIGNIWENPELLKEVKR